jgi:hypothetical protein
MNDYSSGGILKGVNVFDPQDKLHEIEFLRQGISIRYDIQVIHEQVNFNAFLLEVRLKVKSETWFFIKLDTIMVFIWRYSRSRVAPNDPMDVAYSVSGGVGIFSLS